MLSRLIILLISLISLASLQLVLCQQDEADSRVANGPAELPVEDNQPSSSGGGGGGGQSRSIYSQRHLSPHRMMHFGKRPDIEPPPGLTTTEFVDLYPPQANRVPQQQQLTIEELPYSLFFDTKPVGYELDPRSKQMKDIAEHLLKVAKQQACQTDKGSKGSKQQQQQMQQQQQQQIQQRSPMQPARLMKLINSDGGNSYEIAADVERQQQQQAQGEQIDQQQQEQQQTQQLDGSINVVERSLPKARLASSSFDPNKVHIASLLFGRRITEAPSSIMSLGNYIKKAEPQKMTFMHFG